MQRTKGWKAAALLLLVAVVGLGASACSRAEATADGEGAYSDAAKVEPVQGTDLSKVTLSERAAERLGIRTAPVRDARVPVAKGGGTRKVIPYAAVLYDENGDTWTFTTPQTLTFLRQKIQVDYIEGDQAFLLDGPAAGTAVVTVGAAELLGAELGVGEG